jgi:hypothetical protein
MMLQARFCSEHKLQGLLARPGQLHPCLYIEGPPLPACAPIRAPLLAGVLRKQWLVQLEEQTPAQWSPGHTSRFV